MRASNVEEITSHGAGDPWEVFTHLVIQIVEGRTPGGEKGFHAGPHCSLPQYAGINRHVCDRTSPMCARFESLLRQLRLMWGVGVGVSVEVLVAPECQHGAAFTTALDTTTSAPSPQLKLIEQWNFNIFDRNIPDAMISGWSLAAAVRSFLHFSQLSAWLSASGGSRPPNVLYRLTVTSPVFCSKFEADSEEHTFPIANVGQETSIKVVVRSVPRSSKAPVVACSEIHSKAENVYATLPLPPSSPSPPPSPSSPSSSSSVSFSVFSSGCEGHSSESLFTSHSQQNVPKTEANNNNNNSSNNSKAEEDLRRSMMRARLGDPSRASRSESPDTQLGESLLDPPNSLSRIPRRFQSPSRAGSPSMETPEHIICRMRQPGPSHGRPPDISSFCQPLVIPARQPLNAFAWTQTRYPTTQQHQQQYRHHLIHSDMFHPSTIPSTPLPPVDSNQDQQHQYNPNRDPFPFPSNANPPQCFFDPNSQTQIFWPHQTENIPNALQDKAITPFAYRLIQHIPSHFEDDDDGAAIVQHHHHQEQPQSNLFEETQKQKAHHYQQRSFNFNTENSENNLKNSRLQSEINLMENETLNNLPDISIDACYNLPEISIDACSEIVSSIESAAGSSNVGLIVHYAKDPTVSSPVSPSGGRESQGTKRKAAYNKESPRTKRESPPHIYYSKEGRGTEDLKEEVKDDERGKRKNNEEDGGRRKSCSNKRGLATSDYIWPRGSDDQLWPSCSQPGKHLCSSVEDLAEIATKDEEEEEHADFMPNAKSLRKERRSCCKLGGTCNNAKVSFDLTPKETEEILKVLSQNNPVPPLRIQQHKMSAQVSTAESHLKLKSESNVDQAKCLRLIGKLEGTPKLKFDESESTNALAYQKGECSYVAKTVGCHRQDASKTMKRLQKEDESPSYPSSSNKSCDTSFKKSKNCICDRKLNDINMIRSTEFSDLDEGLLDGLSQTEIENLKQSRNLISTSCIEAKKVTHKTSYFTANSQPASGTKDIYKQTSQALVKSSLTSVLSNIKKATVREAKKDNDDADIRERARRSLKFVNVENVSNGSENRSQKGKSFPASPAVVESSQSIMTTSEKEAKKDFAKSVSMLKHLMKKNLEEEKCFEKSWCLEKQRSPERLQRIEDAEPEKVSLNGHNKRSLLNLEEDVSYNEDKEVEDLCRAKGVPIPSSSEKVKFRRSLDSAATLVFHNKTGLPLTSSPAPLRKGTCFDFDSSLNSIAAIRSAFRACDVVDEECDSLCKDSPFEPRPPQSIISASAPATVTCSNLLGSFEECVLNGRLEPVSTVQGFNAEIAASGVFCPKHITKPVTVFFYTLCDNDQISSPYMGHINLGKKGYHIPNKGTVQVTLFNPHGTVVKMFVVVYDLLDMPANSKTFLRQRTLNMPVGASDTHPDAHQWLRYLIHLRFASSKSGKIYLHTDIRMLIFRKSDADAATLHKTNVPYELRSFTHGPTNPRFSPRK